MGEREIDIFDEFRDFFGGAWLPARSDRSRQLVDDHVELEMPGVKRDDVIVTLEQSSLVVAWKRGKSQRSLTFPFSDGAYVDATAKLEDGILKIALERAAKAVGKRIDVTS